MVTLLLLYSAAKRWKWNYAITDKLKIAVNFFTLGVKGLVFTGR